jgi:signal peptidase
MDTGESITALPPARTAIPELRRRSATTIGPRHLVRGLGFAIAGLVAGLALALTAPLPFGFRTLAVLSGSMEPAVHTGDAVVTEGIHPLEARVGDIVTFRDPSRAGRLITHRVRSLRVRSGLVTVTTKGDANNATESWTVPETGTVGRVVYRVPHAGRLLVWSGSPAGRITFVVVPLLLLGVLEIVRIWRTPSEGAR